MKYLNLGIALTFYFLPAYLFFKFVHPNVAVLWLYTAWIGAMGITNI